MKKVLIIWNDAKCINENLTIDEIRKEELIETETIGFLIDKNQDRTVVASTIYKDSTFRDIALIPNSQIIKIIELKEKK